MSPASRRTLWSTRLDNGSLVTLGQPIAGVMSGGGVTLNAGLAPVWQWTALPPAPTFGAVVRLPDGTFQFTYGTQAGRTYEVWASVDLVTWERVQSAAGTGAELTFTDAQAGVTPHRFFRVAAR